MNTKHKVIFGNSMSMLEIADETYMTKFKTPK